ncbi:MAG: hypothetical protein CSA95_02420 [Bacteroidetes bacterium]|nr:MAG: hypothetical protein CSA95_02420 [Bacteroidota bacterium]
MKFIPNITIYILTLLLVSCNTFNEPVKIGELNIDIKKPHALVNHSISSKEGTSTIVLQSLISKNLHFFELKADTILKSYTVKAKNIHFLPFFQLFVKSIDSIVLFNPRSERLTIVDSTGSIIMEQKLNSGVPTSNPENRFIGFGNSLYLGNSNEFYNTTISDERKSYYNTTKPIYEINFQHSEINITQWGDFPKGYTENNHDYCNYFANICPYTSASVLVSFQSDDSLYIYKNGHKIKSVLCNSTYIHEFTPYPEQKRSDMAYYKDYLMVQPKYINLIHDKYRNQYLRVVKHRINDRSDYEHMRWSMIIMDNNLTKKDEFIFDYRIHSPEIIICSNDGIYISKVPSSLEETDHLGLDLLTL